MIRFAIKLKFSDVLLVLQGCPNTDKMFASGSQKDLKYDTKEFNFWYVQLSPFRPTASTKFVIIAIPSAICCGFKYTSANDFSRTYSYCSGT